MRVLSPLVTCIVLLLAACDSDETGSGSDRQPVRLMPDSLWGAESCDAADPTCPDGTFCADLRIQDGNDAPRDSEPLCVDDAICDAVTCADGAQCTIAESSPAQIFCGSTSGGEDGDDPVHS
jgi:hypothetical protein